MLIYLHLEYGNKPSNLLKAAFMKILKKLFNTSDTKIHIDEIALQMGGIPKLLSEAVIVESGSNANGNYVKFGNGTMICWHRKSTINTITIPDGPLFATGSNPWIFPSVFSEPPVVNVMESAGVGGSWGSLGGGATTSYDTTFQIVRTTSYGAIPAAGLMAIGRWK